VYRGIQKSAPETAIGFRQQHPGSGLSRLFGVVLHLVTLSFIHIAVVDTQSPHTQRQSFS
jgi:hypothetical protein